MALIMQRMFENSDEEIDVVTVEDEESNGRLINFDALIWESPCYEKESDSYADSDSDAEDVFIDVVNTSNAFPLEKTDNGVRFLSVQDVSTSFNDTDIFREEASTKISLKRNRHDLDADDNTGEVYSKRNKSNKQANQSPNLLHATKLDHPTVEPNQGAAMLPRRSTLCSPISPTNSLKSKKGVRSIFWYHCPKCNAEKIFDSADKQTNDHQCVNCEIKMYNGQLKINQDQLKCILLTCINCNLKTEATNVYLDSVKCSKCMSNFARSCQNCSNQLTGLLETFCHANKKCKFDFYNCQHCDHKYIGKTDLESHIRENHASFVCPICHTIFKYKDNMLTHKKMCNKPAHLRCCFCSLATKYNYSMKLHLEKKHAEMFETSAKLQAVYESIVENGNSKLRSIPSPQNETDNFKVVAKCTHYCPQCKKIVAVTGKYDEKRCSICNSITMYQCNKCGARKERYKLFYTHLRHTCYPKRVLSCDHCDYTTTIKKTLATHIQISHMYKEYYGQTLPSNKRTYYCPRCEKTVDTSGLCRKKQCLVCKTFVLYQCNKCCQKYNNHATFSYHINDICHP